MTDTFWMDIIDEASLELPEAFSKLDILDRDNRVPWPAIRNQVIEGTLFHVESGRYPRNTDGHRCWIPGHDGSPAIR